MSIFALALAKLIKQLGFSVYTLYNVQRIHCIQCTHCTNCTMYTMYSPTAGNQSSHIVYTQYSWTALPRGSSPPSGLGLSHRQARRRTIYPIYLSCTRRDHLLTSRPPFDWFYSRHSQSLNLPILYTSQPPFTRFCTRHDQWPWRVQNTNYFVLLFGLAFLTHCGLRRT